MLQGILSCSGLFMTKMSGRRPISWAIWAIVAVDCCSACISDRDCSLNGLCNSTSGVCATIIEDAADGTTDAAATEAVPVVEATLVVSDDP